MSFYVLNLIFISSIFQLRYLFRSPTDYNQGMTEQEIPEGFKELKIPQPHIENMGPGYYKKEDDQLFMIFFARKEHSNFYESVHGGALMALADFCLTSSMMKDRNSLVTTVSFHTEFLAPAPLDSMLLIRCRPTKIGKSLGFSEGDITVEGKTIITFGGVGKILKT